MKYTNSNYFVHDNYTVPDKHRRIHSSNDFSIHGQEGGLYPLQGL